MRTLIKAVAVMWLVAPMYAGPAVAAGGLNCRTLAATAEGMRIEFHNASGAELPTGTTAHWRLKGVAQGDVSLSQPLAPGGMVVQDYILANAEAAQGAECSVEAAG